MAKESNVIIYILLGAIFLLMIMNTSVQIFSLIEDDEEAGPEKSFADGNVAVISIKGDIVSDEFPGDEGYVASSSKIVSLIEKAGQNENLNAIVLEINSNGGSGFAAMEIGNALQKTNKTKIAWIKERGLSAAYLIATYADYIIAGRLSDVGSIGVIVEYEIYNVTHETIKAGAYKDIYSTYRPLSEEEKKIVQENVDLQHDIFINEVAKNRKLKISDAKKIAEGLSYLGERAKEFGLIDGIGGKEEAIAFIRKKENIEPVLVYYNPDSGIFELEAPEAPSDDYDV